LRYWSQKSILGQRKIDTSDSTVLFSMPACVFFRPEEDRFTSEALDDARRFESGKVDHWHEKDRVIAGIGNRETEIMAHGKSYRLFATGTLRLDVE